MAADALTELTQLKKKTLADEYGGNQANQFVSDMKASTLFQFNWGELLSAAPTALSLTGACWIAASAPVADQIRMTKSVPVGGFKFIVNRSDPTLRSILVDVCNIGGKDAFKLAAKNMEGLRIRSHAIVNEKMTLIFKRLPACTKGPDQLEDFRDALNEFAEDARQSAVLATQTREAFTRWGSMVGELHAATEHQQGQTSIEREETRSAENVSKIEQRFAVDAASAAKEHVSKVEKQLKKAEKRLDTALDKVPGSWETVIQGAVTGYSQALPSIIAGVLPVMMATSNPFGVAAMGVTGASSAAARGTGTINGTTGAPGAVEAAVRQGVGAAQRAGDPSYAAAGELRDLVTHFYEFLGGEKGNIDWAKFEEPQDGNTESGTSYLLATLKGRQGEIDRTDTAPNKKLNKVIDGLIEVINEISITRKDQTDLNAAKVGQTKIDGWRKTAKQAQIDVLQLAASAPIQGGANIPGGFGNVKIDVPKTDLSAQNAQLSSAMQGVSIAQNAVDVAQSSYDAAVKKQAETAKAMAEVEKRLKSLQEKGKTLDEIKTVLRDCIAVLVDLVIQIGKIEKFFTMLTTVIDHVVIPQAERFTRDMGKVGTRAARDKYISVDDVAKQTIYVSTLQLKAYFSLLEDITAMYSQVDRQYISPGMTICDKLSAGKVPIDQLSQELSKFSAESAEAVASFVSAKQQEVLKGLKDRAQKAAENSEAIENTVRDKGLRLDGDSKAAIEKGAGQAKQEIQTLIDGKASATALSNEDIELEI